MRRAGLELLKPREGESILEVGFGAGHSLVSLAKAIGPKRKVFGLDLSDGMLKLAKANLAKAGLLERARLRCGDTTRLPYGAGTLDGVFMSFPLELFDTPEIPKVLRECKCVSRSGGRIAMTAANVLAGELKRTIHSPGSAFERYERLLHPFVLAKQKAVQKFSGSFAPKTRPGLFRS